MSKIKISKKILKVQKQKIQKTREELRKIFQMAGLNEINTKNTGDDMILPKLNFQKKALINKVILDNYLWIDSRLNILIRNFFFKDLIS